MNGSVGKAQSLRGMWESGRELWLYLKATRLEQISRIWISGNMAPVGKYSYSALVRILLFLSPLCSASGGKLLVVPMDESH